MYLILKAHCPNEDLYEGNVPDIAVVEVDRSLDYLEDCSVAVLRLSSRSKRSGLVNPSTMIFKTEEPPRWFRYDFDLENCDFYADVQNYGFALVNNLPGILKDQNGKELEVPSDNHRIVIDTDRDKEMGLEAVIAKGSAEVYTAPFHLDAVRSLKPFDGVVFGSEPDGGDPGPSR